MSTPETPSPTLEAEISKLSAAIQSKKEQIIRERLKKIGRSAVLKDFHSKRFKKLIIEDDGTHQRVWIDNGTLTGQLLVTFLKASEPTSLPESDSINIKLKYF
jgi:hypothetical protein